MVQLVHPETRAIGLEWEEEPRKAVVILSGGIDSTTLLYDLIEQKYKVYPMTFLYGQRHIKEVEAASQTCIRLNVPHKRVDISILGSIAASALTNYGIDIPKVGYDSSSMKDTVVPNRNMVFISLAAAYAIGLDAKYLFMGVHGGDHAIYPDCRPAFLAAMERVLGLCHYDTIVLRTPYVHWRKRDIVKRGIELGVDFSLTWSCYEGKEFACGQCGTCRERLEAFKLLGVEDSIRYASQVDYR